MRCHKMTQGWWDDCCDFGRCLTWRLGASFRESKTISLREHPSFSSRSLPNLIAVLYWKEFLRRKDSFNMREHREADIMSKVRNAHCACLILLEGIKILGRSSPLFSSKNGRKFFFATHLGRAPSYCEA